jgi:hypothetical protein
VFSFMSCTKHVAPVAAAAAVTTTVVCCCARGYMECSRLLPAGTSEAPPAREHDSRLRNLEQPAGTSPARPMMREPQPEPQPKPGPQQQPQPEADVPGQYVTVIVTTSYVMSHPSTALLETVLASFSLVPGLAGSRTIIVCDGYKLATASKKTTGKGRRRGANNQSKLGYVSEAGAARYKRYVEQVQGLAATTWCNTQVLVLAKHHGFAYAVKAALQQCVTTEFVMVVQHDYVFLRGFDLSAVLTSMRRCPELKYIGMCVAMRAYLGYRAASSAVLLTRWRWQWLSRLLAACCVGAWVRACVRAWRLLLQALGVISSAGRARLRRTPGPAATRAAGCW